MKDVRAVFIQSMRTRVSGLPHPSDRPKVEKPIAAKLPRNPKNPSLKVPGIKLAKPKPNKL
jgi:hypothetical protein